MEHINQNNLEAEYWVAYHRIKAKPLPSSLTEFKAYRLIEPPLFKIRESV